MTVKEQKNEVRRQLKAITKAMSEDYKQESSHKICEKCVSCEEFKNAENIFVFISMDGEPITTEIIEKAFAEGKNVYVPRCLGHGIMEAIRITSFDQLEKRPPYGILEPKEELQPTAAEEFDSENTIGFIPCVGAALDGRRLGHGAGYYDRFLEGRSMKRFLLAYSRQICEDIPCDQYDLPMDRIITE